MLKIMKLLLICLLASLLSCSTSDRPNIEVYQMQNDEAQVLYMNCRCRHECYYLFTENAVWWYAEAHIKKDAKYSHKDGKKRIYKKLENNKLVYLEKDTETFSNVLLGRQKLKRVKVSGDMTKKMFEDIKNYKEK